MPELVGHYPGAQAAGVKEGSYGLAVGVRHDSLEAGALTHQPEVPLDVVPIPEPAGRIGEYRPRPTILRATRRQDRDEPGRYPQRTKPGSTSTRRSGCSC